MTRVTCPVCRAEVTRRRDPLGGTVMLNEDLSRHTCPPVARAAAAMSEADVERAVARNAKQLGLLAYHTRMSKGSPHGWCDWVLAGPGGVLFRELKRQSESPTPAQQAWLDALASHGLDAGVWRPSDLLSGRLGQEMAALAGMRVSA